MFEVILNRHTGEDFENEVSCDNCKQKGTVAVIFKQRICKTCVEIASVEISRVVYQAMERNRPPYKELPMRGRKIEEA